MLNDLTICFKIIAENIPLDSALNQTQKETLLKLTTRYKVESVKGTVKFDNKKLEDVFSRFNSEFYSTYESFGVSLPS